MMEGLRLKRDDWSWLVSSLLIGCLALGGFALHAHHFTASQGGSRSCFRVNEVLGERSSHVNEVHTHTVGVPLDDAWIHFQFARNLARGDGLSFNPGHPTSGSTAPLWTLLLAALYIVVGVDNGPVAGQFLSATCFLAAVGVTYVLGKRLTGKRWTAWLASAIVATNGRMVWAGLSGLETCLFAMLALLAISAHLSDRAARRYRLRTAALFGLAALSRPEGYLLFALAMVDSVVGAVMSADLRSPHEGRRSTSLWRRLPLLPVSLFAVIVLPYLVFSLRTSGHLLPNTYHAKVIVDFRPDLAFLSVTSRYLILDNPLLLPFYVLGVGMLFRRATLQHGYELRSPGGRSGSLLSLWSVGLPLVYAFLHAVLYQHGRYLIPLIPCNAVIGVVGLLEARRLAALRGYRWRGSEKRLTVLVSLLLIVATAWRLPTMARLYAWNVDNINKMHVAIGHWVAEHTPSDATLALNDIGAIAYISERPVLDLAGLVTPEVVPLLRAPDWESRLADFIVEQDAQYVIIFPNWFPGLAARRDLLEPVYQVTLERNTICGGQTMVVYRVHRRE
jgi:hypothetical protein